MANVSILNKEKNYFNRKRLINKNKEEFKSELLDYAKSNFPDKISDFSEASLGGMLLDFAAIVGESLTYYIDQQINELDYETASSEYSILNHLRKANVTSGLASPSSVEVYFYILVPAIENTDDPDIAYCPVFKRETQLSSIGDITFILEEDVDFSKNPEILRDVDASGNRYLLLRKSGICTSGQITNESFAFNESSEGEFLTFTLNNDNVTKILKVIDNSSDLNEYKEVEFLSQDTIYEKTQIGDSNFINIVPASFKYTIERDFENGLTSLRFGNSGSNKIIEDGILTNPEELSLPLLSRDYINNFSLDPKKLLGSSSLGVSPAGKVLNVKYKFGGGEDHNVQARSINSIDNLIYNFPNLQQEGLNTDFIINSASVENEREAVGGSNALSLEDLKDHISSSMKSQSRIVTHEDLLARIYSMPSDFGRVKKVAILDNPYSKSAKDLYVICSNDEGYYVKANDALKYNLSKFLNEYRLIGDTYNIIDADIFNISVYLKIKISSNYDQKDVVSEVQTKIFTLMRFEKLQIGEPINVNKIVKIALDTPGVLTISSNFKTIVRSITNENINRINSNNTNRFYNNNSFSVFDRYDEGIITPPKGGIFQLKYSDDIEIVSG